MTFTDDAGNEETLTSAATAAVAAKPNAPATGAPTISGTAQVDETLTADTSGITDADGLDNAEFSYQWIRTDGGTDDDIAGATESTYTLTDDDEGKTIKLKVWFIDDKGNSETLTSAATADVGEPQFLVSNLGAGVSGAGGIQRTLYTARSGFAQAFTTGAKTGGYPLGSVGIQVSHFYDGSTVGDHLQVTINGVASEGEPGDAHCTLTNPSSFSTPGVSAFEAPTGAGSCAQLATETTYFVVIEWVDPSGTDHFALIPQTYPTEESAATEEDPGGAEGWSIADQSYYLTVSSNDRTWTAYDQTASFKIVVKEAAVTAAEANSPATGAPTISGTAQAGQTLTADTSGITDANGLTNVTFSYQWLADDADIGGETASTYAVSDAAVGKAISVRVTFTDNADNDESLTSEATAVVTARPNTPATGVPTISGTVQVDETLTADASGIDDADGLTNVSYSYQWLADDADIQDATGSTYTLTDDAVGKVDQVCKATFTDNAGNEESLTSGATAEVEARPNSPATGAPTISGTAQAGETLTADTSGITDADGLTNVSYSYQWLAEDADIGGETASTYAVSDDAVGKAISVRVTFTDNAGNEESLTSGATAVVTARPNSPATGAPTISGTAQVGETLTADTSPIADEDGLENVTFSYQWIRSDNGADTDISGETDSTYTLVLADLGKTIEVQVTFTDDDDNAETLTSVATEPVSAAANNPATGVPTISGTVQVGEALTADTSGITDADGLTNVTFSYQWLADDADIQDATGSTYTLTDDDVGKAISVRVTFTDNAGNEESLTSEATAEVTARPNSPATGAPTISGTAQVGETLTADTSPIADEDGLTNVSYSYQWIRSDNGADTDISGETDSTYTLVLADLGKTIEVQVTFTDDDDNAETLTSGATEPVSAAANNPATGVPTISGTVQVGEALTADTSGITDEDGLTNVTFSYQWLADDADIQDDTGSTYTLTDDDVGKVIKVKVTFTDNAGNEESLTSEATAEVTARPNSPATGAPTISGTAQVGETLTADTSPIADEDGLTNVSYSYQWLADDADIGGETASTYTLSDDDVGKVIKVKVTFTDNAGNEESLTSEATAEVEARPNSPATGAPAISGTAQAGETLTADTSGITDANGLTNVAFSYQWLADDADIGGETASTYAVSDDAVGKAISVRVTFTDDRDNEESLTSEATAEVTARPDSPDTDAPPSDTGTTVEITVGDTVAGDIAEASEVDWFKVRLLASETYRIDMRGAWGGAWAEVDGKIVWVSAGTLEDPKLLGVFGEDNALVPGTDEEESGNDRGEYSEGKNSRITSFSPPADGYYYIAAAADGAWTGTYELIVTVVTDE